MARVAQCACPGLGVGGIDVGNRDGMAVVEFGPRIVAKTSLAGGVSGDPASPYFMNQAEDYAKGQFKSVHYYRDDVEKNAKRTYHPGQ